MKQKWKKIGVGCIMLVLVILAGVSIWLAVTKNRVTKTDKEEIVKKNELGVEWYDENETEFTLTTAEQLIEFSKLSSYYDFAGQTIKLGADIVVNEGNAADWEKDIPKVMWDAIGDFAGTFDGQGHTISGICCYGQLYRMSFRPQAEYYPAGLFRFTKESCVIKNFKLVNSFFKGDMQYGAAAISSNGSGTFDSIYTDAIILNYRNHTGGILGRTSMEKEETLITNCWFDGVIRVEGNSGVHIGGMVGRVMPDDTCTVEHCLNTGVISSDAENKGVQLGGLVGNFRDSTVKITDCLAAGELKNEWKSCMGSVVGNVSTNANCSISDTYALKECWDRSVGAVLGTLDGYPVSYAEEDLKGLGGYQWTTLDFDKYWAAVPDGIPVLKTFAKETVSCEGIARKVDVSWYDENENTYVLKDEADFYGFTLLSASTNFEGKTVKLAANLTLNNGRAEDWAKQAPENKWLPIGSNSTAFEGTFDGQMHTISGVYMKADQAYGGLFGVIGTKGKVKNFSLKNSYFETSKPSFGSIAGRCRGSLDTVYSDAIVVSNEANVGGMIGQVPADGKVTLNNCWFAGKVTKKTNEVSKRGAGGLIGTNLSNSSQEWKGDLTKITNCLFTGTVDVSVYNAKNPNGQITPFAGGFVGTVGNKSIVNISDSLSTGTIQINKAVTAGYGPVIGYVSNGNVALSQVYASDACKKVYVGAPKMIDGEVTIYNQSKLNGYAGYQWTTLDFDRYWTVVIGPDGAPILKSFANKIPSVAGIVKLMDTSWYDAKQDVYILYDLADLNGFALLSQKTDFKGKTIKLGADIVMNTGNAVDWAFTAPAYTWSPIGPSANTVFEGTFDGQGHTISGIYLKTDARDSGLFGVIGVKGKVKNFSLKNSYFESTAKSFGSIAGRLRGTIDTVYSDAVVVSNTENVGGMIGQIYDENGGTAILNNCWFAGTVTNKSNDNAKRGTGGLVGSHSSNSKITNCLFTGIVDVSVYNAPNANNAVTPFAGGFVGQINMSSKANISDSLSAGTIKVHKDVKNSYGPFIGYVLTGKAALSQVYALESDACNKYIGDPATIEGEVTVYDQSKLDGYAGYQWTTLDFDRYWAVVTGPDGAPILKSFANKIPSVNGIVRLMDTSWYDEKKDVYILYDLADLNGFALLSQKTDFKGKTIKLGENIVMNTGEAADWASTAPAYTWSPIGPSANTVFEGTFDGQGKTISGIYLKTNVRDSGLFGVIGVNGKVMNFSLKNSYFETTAKSFGSIAGRLRGTIDTVYSDAIVVSNNENVGGLIGQIYDENGGTAMLNNCWFAGTVTNKAIDKTGSGGLIGSNSSNSNITNCLFTGTVEVSNVTPYAGGFAGLVNVNSNMDISYSLSTGTMKVNTATTVGYGSFIGSVSKGSKASLSQIYASREERVDNKGTIEGEVTVYDQSKLNGYAGYQWTTLDFDKYWTVVVEPDGAPILKSFTDKIPSVDGIVRLMDTSWYDEKKDVYTLYDLADLNGFALLSQKTDFKGKTIKLGADIVMNTGEAAKWEKDAPLYTWTPIGPSASAVFEGIFDGQGKTISGIYLKTNVRDSGLFGVIGVNGKVMNFSLKNSYFETTAKSFGSIAGRLRGNIDTVYSDAIVVSNNENVGGLIGQIYDENGGTAILNNCWFAGTVINKSNDNTKRGTGGLAGSNSSNSKITNCLFTGIIDVSVYNAPNANKAVTPFAGGFVGQINVSSKANISDSLSAGTIKVHKDVKNSYGPVIGYVVTGSAALSQVYALESDACNKYIGDPATIDGKVTVCTQSELSGEAARQSTKLDFDKYWTIVADNVPILKSFANKK